MKHMEITGNGSDSTQHRIGQGRYQIFRQTRSGIYSADWRCDASDNAVDAFLRASPWFEGGEIRLWDNQARRLVAVVRWEATETDFGFFVLRRISLFHDRAMASVARQIRRRESIECSIENKKGTE